MSRLGARIDTVCRMTKAKNLRRSSCGHIMNHIATLCGVCGCYTTTRMDHAQSCIDQSHWGKFAVTGPYRIGVRRTPSGVSLDISHYIEQLLVELILNHDEAIKELLDASMEELGQLAEQIVDALSPEFPIYGREVNELAACLKQHSSPRHAQEQQHPVHTEEANQ